MLARRLRAPTALLLGLAVAAACTPAGSTGSDGGSSASASASSGGSGGAASSSTTVLADSHEDETDYQWDAASEVAILLSDGSSTAGDGVTIDGDVVTITAAGTFRISGSLSDGRIVVDTDADDVVRLVLDGVDIASSTTAPIAVADAAKVVVILADGSQNRLTDATTYQFESADVDEPNAALFSTADLTIAGQGSLVVNANYDDGIASKDGLVIAGGSIAITAVDDGIRGKDYVIVQDGTLEVDAGGDAIKADNAEDATRGYVAISGGTLALTAGTDAIDASTTAVVSGGELSIAAGDDAIHAETRLEVHGGTIDISRSYEGLEATQIVITGGAIELVAEDDGLNVAGGNDGSAQNGPGDMGGPGGGPGGEVAIEGYYVAISGGTLVIDAGGDGFDSNGSAAITGGTVVVNGPTSDGNGAIDVNGEFLISDALLIAAGSAGMAETPSATSDQPSLVLTFDAAQPAGTIVRIQASDGTNVATFEASKPFQSLVFSSATLVRGTTYDVFVGGSVSGTSVGGLYLDPAYTSGTSVGTVSAAS
jgi:hypothetical protein